ncbi:MAG: AEC family transporter [Bacteroidales bacterium]|nr:AEC family transporter [Bacteroidales bacterium]
MTHGMDMGHIIIYAIVPIIVVMGAGFIAGKKGAFDGSSSKILNKVVLDFALPAALFISIVSVKPDELLKYVKLSVISLVVIMACFMAVYYIYRYWFKAGAANAAVMALISGSPTIGFLGFAVLEPIFDATVGLPAVALVVAIVGIVVNAVGIPVGLSLLNSADAEMAAKRNGGKKPSFWGPVIHALAQPVAWAPILAVVMVCVGFNWPEDLSPSFDLIKKANASVAVFAAGITLSSVKVTIDWQAICGSILKLIVMPLLLLVVGIIFKMDYWNLQMLVVAGVLPPAFSGIIIADEYSTYVARGTSSLALSVILFMGFCPLWIWITDVCAHHFLPM